MQQITYNVQGIRLLGWDGKRSFLTGYATPRMIEITVADDYDPMADMDSPVCDVLEKQLRDEGYKFATINYTAHCVDGPGCSEERKTLSIMNAEAVEGSA